MRTPTEDLDVIVKALEAELHGFLHPAGDVRIERLENALEAANGLKERLIEGRVYGTIGDKDLRFYLDGMRTPPVMQGDGAILIPFPEEPEWEEEWF